MMSFEECQEWGRKMREEEEKRKTEIERIRQEELKKIGINPNTQKCSQPKYDHPCTPDDRFVTILYVIGMIGSLMFKQWYIAWFALTVWYGMFITRHDND